MLQHLKAYLSGKVVILGIGNTFRGDDGIGSLLAQHLKNKIPSIVYDAGTSPENYLGKIIKDKPDNIIIIDAVDFGGVAGDFKVMGGQDIKTTNLFSTHNASISLTINYLQNNLKTNIIILLIQPKDIRFADNLTPELTKVLERLENWFYEQGKTKG